MRKQRRTQREETHIMSRQKLDQLWGIIGIASVIIMFIVMFTTNWPHFWIIPVIGALIGSICNFIFSKDECGSSSVTKDKRR